MTRNTNGLRRGGGRPKGVPNKANGELRAAAQQYSTAALSTLAAIMKSGASEQARVAAANALLDRGYGKPAQALTEAEGGPLIPATVQHIHVHE
jgi:hypothetical protein